MKQEDMTTKPMTLNEMKTALLENQRARIALIGKASRILGARRASLKVKCEELRKEADALMVAIAREESKVEVGGVAEE